MKLMAFIISVAILVSGCTAAVRSTSFHSYSPKPVDHPIKVYRLKSPQCEFEEVGIVNSRQRNKLISMEEVMGSLLAEARRMGGDAVVGLNETNPIHNVSAEHGIDRDPVLSGTVIRFTDSSCQK